jgi:2-dehydropantoate 2-reductase
VGCAIASDRIPAAGPRGRGSHRAHLGGEHEEDFVAPAIPNRSCRNDAIRRFSIKLGGEAVRVGQALGYHIEKIGKMEPETLAKASEGDRAALDEIETILRPGSNTNPNPRADIQRPSMAQDIRKGRRTEIEFMNGYVAERGAYIGVPAPTHTKLTEIVKKVERQEIKAAPALLGG